MRTPVFARKSIARILNRGASRKQIPISNLLIGFFTIPLFISTCDLLAEKAPTALGNEDVWIISGQSNANGKRPGPVASMEKVQWYYPEGKKFRMLDSDMTGLTRTGKGSPFFTAAQEVAHAGIMVKMLGYSQGNKRISHWADPADRKFEKKEKSGLDILRGLIAEAGQGATVFIWYQGESNNTIERDTYPQDLAGLVRNIRAAAANPDMTVVIVQLGGWKQDKGEFFTVREMQRQFVIADGNAVLVPACGRELEDIVHLTPTSQIELGKEIGRAILKTRHKKQEVNWPGPVLDQVVMGNDSKTVIAHFAEVKKLSGCVMEDFKVIDADGVVKCTRVTGGNTLATLIMERDIKLPAKLGFAYEQNPKAELRDEAGNHAPAVLMNIDPTANIADEPTIMPNGAGKKL